MKAFPVALMLAVLAGPAWAQAPALNLMQDKRPLTSEELEKQKAIDEAYRASIKKIPDQKPSADPWGNVRANEPATGTQTKASQTKSSLAKSGPTKSSQTKSTQTPPQPTPR
jgi:hypothetical protein